MSHGKDGSGVRPKIRTQPSRETDQGQAAYHSVKQTIQVGRKHWYFCLEFIPYTNLVTCMCIACK